MRSIGIFASVYFVAITAHAAPAQNPTAIEHHLRYAVRVEGKPDVAMELLDRMRSYHVPGLSIAVIDNYRVVFAKGYGVAEFGGSNAVDSTTLFLAGSISKPVFASAFLRVAEDRKISLDADINTLLKSWHLPDSRFTEREKVTPRRLLTHSAGLTVWGFPGYTLGTPVPTVAQLLDGTPPANTAAVRNDTVPGARWLYSGGGITILQLATTDITAEDFPTLMRRLMLQPAGMTRSTYENPLPVNRRGEAASGHEQTDTPVPGGFHVYPEMAAAGLWTTPSDLARWAIALSRSYRGERGGVLSTSMARQMVSKQMHQQPPYGDGYWGLGVAVAGDGDSLSFSHGGRDEGFVADLFMRPASGRGLVVMMNGVAGGLIGEIERAFAEEYGFGGPPRTTRAVVAKSASDLGAYVGRYVGVFGRDTARFDVSVAPDGSTLQVQNSLASRAFPIVPLGGDRFLGLEGGGEWTFERTGDDASPVRSLASGTGPNRRVLVREQDNTNARSSADGVILAFARFADIFGGRLVAAFDSIPAARYSYRPTPKQQTIGFIAQHLENANYSLCERFADLKHPRTSKDSMPDTVRARWPKDTLVARLDASLRFCDSAIQRAGPLNSPVLANFLLAFETDLAEHYSQLSSYMRLLGMVPPSALPPRPRTAIELPVDALSPYVGVYQVAPGWEIHITMQNGSLLVQSTAGGAPARLWPENKNDFFLKEVDAQITFTRDGSGAVTGLLVHQFGRDRPAKKIR